MDKRRILADRIGPPILSLTEKEQVIAAVENTVSPIGHNHRNFVKLWPGNLILRWQRQTTAVVQVNIVRDEI